MHPRRADQGRDRHRRHVHRRRRRRRGDRRARHHQDAVDPGRPGRRLPGRDRQGARPARGSTGDDGRGGQPRHHGRHQPAARGQGRPARLRHHRGLRRDARDRPAVGAGRLRQLLLLGEAAADRAGATWSARSAAGSTSPAPRCGRSTRTARARWPGGSATAGVDTHRRLLPALLRRPGHERADARGARARSTPTRSCRISSEVLREYREYERAMTTLVDAAVKPRLSAYVANISARLPLRQRDAATPACRST